MNRISITFFLLIVCCGGVFAQQKITVAVAANMRYTMGALIKEFNKTDRTEIVIVLGSSGKLTQQIMQSAPFHILISADTMFSQKLADTGFAVEPPRVYAEGLLVLWTAKQNLQPTADLKLLTSPSIRHIALANPKTAPYGAAAESILKKYNLYNAVSSKFVTGESITQTSQFIATQAADIGFTAKSIVVSDEMKGKGRYVELDQNDYPPIRQAAVLLKYAQQNNPVEAKKFYDFLYSEKAKAIYKKFGYIIK